MANPARQAWIQEYATRIVDSWKQWESPLGLDDDYENQVQSDLVSAFEDPLKRSLIESTY